jgi:branched-subunit amino acid ABC-type transport system permease component
MEDGRVLVAILIDTLVRTSQLSLVAVGLSMTWGIVRFANVAHVQYAPVGAYLALVGATGLGLGVVAGSLVGIVAAGLLGVLLHLFFFRRLASFSSATALIGSLALSIVITASIQAIAGPRPERLPLPSAPGIPIGDAFVTRAQLYVVVLAALIFVAVFFVLAFTNLGRAIRCVAANPDLASASGIDVKRISTVVVFAAAALAATGGVFIAVDTSISLEMGSALLLAVFAAVIMGGIGSVGGALLAAAILALAESTVLRVDFGALFGSDSLLVPISYRPAVGFVAVILVMLFRPQGLFGLGGRRA